MHTLTAKDIVVKPINRKDADRIIKKHHYSGKVVNNSQFHVGVFLSGRLEGAMQFGPSLDKRKIIGLVDGTGWNEFIELNRMAFSDVLPRNSESRAIAITFRMMRKFAPHIKWVISFADGTLCGDGTIYRAAGFVLTGIKVNDQLWSFPSGEVATRMVATDTRRPQRQRLMDSANEVNENRDNVIHALNTRSVSAPRQLAAFSRGYTTKGNHITETGGASMKPFIEAGAKPLAGFQLRYLYFLDATCKERLTVPILPFSEIEKRGAGMYKGQTRVPSADSGTSSDQLEGGGATPTGTLSPERA